jgi:hypothetical protein
LKFLRFVFLFAAALAGAALAQESPSEVTDGEIAKYKAIARKACREPGIARGDPQESIDSFCNCIMTTLEKNLKRPEWQQLYFYSIKNQMEQELEVLTPHRRNLAGCRPAK